MSEFDPKKMKELGKEVTKTDSRYLNIRAYSYDGGEPKISIIPRVKNTNPNADKNKQWITQKGISGITKQEALDLAKALEKAVHYLK